MRPETETRAPSRSLEGQVPKGRPHNAPRLLPSRCRDTWLVHHLAAGTRLDVLIAAAGYSHPQYAVRLVPFLTPLHPEDTTAMLRDAPAPL